MEEELTNIPYLVGKGPKKILKRNVPKRLLAVAGQTAWVDKKLSGMSAREIRQRASVFAVETDAKIKQLERELELYDVSVLSAPENPIVLELSETETKQLAISYFWKQDQKRRQSARYEIKRDDPNYIDEMEDAGHDVFIAKTALREEVGNAENDRALEVLVNARVIYPAPKNDQQKREWLSILKEHANYQLLCSLIHRADLELANQRLQSLTDAQFDYASDRFFSSSVPSIQTGVSLVRNERSNNLIGDVKTIRELVSAFLEDKKGEVGKSRYDQFQIPARVLKEFFGETTPINQVSGDQLMEVLDFLPQIPAHVTKRYPKMSLRQASEAYEKENGEKPNRYSEAQKTLSAMGQIFKFSKERLWIGACNPVEDLKIKVPAAFKKKHHQRVNDGFAPYSLEDLNKIFGSAVYTANKGRSFFPGGIYRKSKPGQLVRDQMYWAPLLGLWTGARMNEILQLERADVQKRQGVHFIQVTDDAELEYMYDNFEKQVKNPNAVRDIPLHPFLIQIGFIDWVYQTKSGRIFPDAHRGKAEKPSLTFSKNYRGHAERLGVWEKHKKVFHSFRNNFNDELTNSGVHSEIRITINGWEKQQKMDDVYGRGFKVEKLYEEGISKISYADVDWDAVKASVTMI